jgi:hypothetical protein
MRYGTFTCFMWGHKFIARDVDEKSPSWTKTGHKIISTRKVEYCTRCGVKDDSIKNNQE